MSQTTTPPNVPEVLPLPKWHEELVGMMPGKGLYEHQQEWVKYEDASVTVAELLAREAALVAELLPFRELVAAGATPGAIIWPNKWPQDVAMIAFRIWKAESERDALAAFDRLLAADLEYDAALAEKWNMPSPVDDQTIDRVVARFKAATDERAAAIRACKELRRS